LWFFFASRKRQTRLFSDWGSDVCSSYLLQKARLPENPDALETLTFERMRILKDALATDNDTMIDHVVRTQKGNADAASAPSRLPI